MKLNLRFTVVSRMVTFPDGFFPERRFPEKAIRESNHPGNNRIPNLQ